jgi:hypothetical protein
MVNFNFTKRGQVNFDGPSIDVEKKQVSKNRFSEAAPAASK